VEKTYCDRECIAAAAITRRNNSREIWPPQILRLHQVLLRLIESERFAGPHERALLAAQIRQISLQIERLKTELLASEAA
jgi:hypothetical protein